jgi:hypothetical protein
MCAPIEESVVPVASKNTRNGEIPDTRTALAFNANDPLVPVQLAPALGSLTVTVVDCCVLPPGPVQFNV